MTEQEIIEWAQAVTKFRNEHPAEYAAIVERNKKNWAACTYDHSVKNMVCNKCGWNDFTTGFDKSGTSMPESDYYRSEAGATAAEKAFGKYEVPKKS